ncbi:hypothetical protein AMECASPLE_004774 [Ameca splendens]|uniref:Uncharacterized protein n=1 Tax=Ameca splendens TaxID=208324 RepID=A0ABV0YLB3_9TELE
MFHYHISAACMSFRAGVLQTRNSKLNVKFSGETHGTHVTSQGSPRGSHLGSELQWEWGSFFSQAAEQEFDLQRHSTALGLFCRKEGRAEIWRREAEIALGAMRKISSA